MTLRVKCNSQQQQEQEQQEEQQALLDQEFYQVKTKYILNVTRATQS